MNSFLCLLTLSFSVSVQSECLFTPTSKIELQTAVDEYFVEVETWYKTSRKFPVGLLHPTKGNIAEWDVSLITDMSSLFKGPSGKDPNDGYHYFHAFDISKWDTSRVTDMSHMFEYSWVGDITAWDVSSVTDMSYMFRRSLMDKELTFEDWDVSSVTTMSNMFSGHWADPVIMTATAAATAKGFIDRSLADAFKTRTDNVHRHYRIKGLQNWDISSVMNMSGMFYFYMGQHFPTTWGRKLKGDISYMVANFPQSHIEAEDWDVSKVTNMKGLFCSNNLFNDDVSGWQTGWVTDISNLFWGCRSFNRNINNWDVSQVVKLEGLFSGPARDFKNFNFSRWSPKAKLKTLFTYTRWHALFNKNAFCTKFDVKNWVISDDDIQDTYDWFEEICKDTIVGPGKMSKRVHSLFAYQWNTELVWEISDWNIYHAVYCAQQETTGTEMGTECNYPNMADWNTTRVTDMRFLFSDFNPAYDIEKILKYEGFPNSILKENTIGNWDTSNVKSMAFMFYDTQSKSTSNIYNWEVQDISNWKVSKVIDMESMFHGVKPFNFGPLGRWDVAQVVNMASMFKDSDFNEYIGAWNTEKMLSKSHAPLSDMWETFANWFKNLPPFIIGQPNGKVALEWWIGCRPVQNPKECWFKKIEENKNMTLICTDYNQGKNFEIMEWDSQDTPASEFPFKGTLQFLLDNGASPDSKYDILASYRGLKEACDEVSRISSGESTKRRLYSSNPRVNQDKQPIANMFSGATLYNKDMFTKRISNIRGAYQAWDFINFNGKFANMFYNAKAFNKDISNWNIRGVTDMSEMFMKAETFNQPLQLWNVGGPTKLNEMFKDAVSFNQNIDSWFNANLLSDDGYYVAEMSTCMLQNATAFACGDTSKALQKIIDNCPGTTYYSDLCECPPPCNPGQGIQGGVCVNCPKGSYSPHGLCIECPKGSYSFQPGQSSCSVFTLVLTRGSTYNKVITTAETCKEGICISPVIGGLSSMIGELSSMIGELSSTEQHLFGRVLKQLYQQIGGCPYNKVISTAETCKDYVLVQ